LGKTLGIISLVFGIIGLISIIFAFYPLPFVVLWYTPLISSVVTIICGSIGIKKDDSPGLSIAGLILGLIGVIIWVIALIMVILF